MKKYLLTALLGVFACIGFVSADTLGNFTSDSEICTYSFSDSSYVEVSSLSQCGVSDNYSNGIKDFYACLDSGDSGFVMYGTFNGNDGDYITPTLPFCFSLEYADVSLEFYDSSSDFQNDNYIEENISGTIYYSVSSITYSSSSGGSSGGSSSEGILNATGQAYLGNVISGVQSVVTEFIPYMVYLALGILVVTLGFIAIRRLMSYTSRRVTGLFSSRKRK